MVYDETEASDLRDDEDVAVEEAVCFQRSPDEMARAEGFTFWD